MNSDDASDWPPPNKIPDCATAQGCTTNLSH